jgi:hypothetical protein
LGALLASLASRSGGTLGPGFSLWSLWAYCPLRAWGTDLASGPCWTLCAYRPLLAFNTLRARWSCGTCRSRWPRGSCRSLWAGRRLAAREKRQSHRDRHDTEQWAHGCLPFRTMSTGRGITLEITPISRVTMVRLRRAVAKSRARSL